MAKNWSITVYKAMVANKDVHRLKMDKNRKRLEGSPSAYVDSLQGWGYFQNSH